MSLLPTREAAAVSAGEPTLAFRQARFGAPLVLLGALLAACNSDDADIPSDPTTETFAPALGIRIADMTMVQSGLYYQDIIAVGSGIQAISGRTLTVRYTGWLTDGTQFDTGTGLTFVLGRGSVIAGWDLGLVGARVGTRRKLVIASPLAYGSGGQGSIGPNQTLVFDVTVQNIV
ncbi:MAG: FKBP-type peptidyl-prolyl cis-trans isomerase [Gemmatimonas sp.]